MSCGSQDYSIGAGTAVIRCPDCKNEFVQPFVCTTCGAQKLYDKTLLTAQAEVARLEGELLAISQDDGKVERALARSEEEIARLTGYRDAFYEIAELLEIPAMPTSPCNVFRDVMIPKIQALLGAVAVPNSGTSP